MTLNTDTSLVALLANEASYDPIEDRLRQNIRATIEMLFEEERVAFIGRCRYGENEEGKITEWRSRALLRYHRLTKSEADQETVRWTVPPRIYRPSQSARHRHQDAA